MYTKKVIEQKSERAVNMEYAPPGSLSRDLKYYLVLVGLSVLLNQKVLSHVSKVKGLTLPVEEQKLLPILGEQFDHVQSRGRRAHVGV